MDLFSDTIKDLQQLFSKKQKIALIIHCNPDGDAIGSALALKHYFENSGHVATVISPNDYSDSFKWMPNIEKTLIFETQKDEVLKTIDESDIIFGVDFNDWARTNKLSNVIEKLSKIKIVIDHHPSPSPNLNADYLYSCTKVSSAAEIVYEFMLCLGISKLNTVIASCIFTGVMTDTGNFSYNDSNPRTYSIISELADYGVDKEKIRRSLFQVFTFNRMRLKGYALNQKMNFFPEFHTAYIWLTQKDLEQFNFKLGDTEGFVNLPLSIKEVYFSVLFIEKDNKIKMSLRSKGNFDVNLFARKNFDGGGHLNAAGGRSFKSMEKTLAKFEALLVDYKDEIAKSYSYD
ncbi:MAG: bifunctional oligoribonuclease/PAP phosphatase NrnA [Bacteroidales bacterium]|nr:bifunctional oligoribonuclease/PAP phosphatase NrnA [Bacteroidales bacterium]